MADCIQRVSRLKSRLFCDYSMLANILPIFKNFSLIIRVMRATLFPEVLILYEPGGMWFLPGVGVILRRPREGKLT